MIPPTLRLFLCLLFFLPFSLFAQNAPPIKAVKLNSELNFDGKVNEAFWENIPTIPVRQYVPNYNQPPTERTEIRLAYDDDYLYLSGKNYLSDPKYLRNTTFKRDVFDATTDYFGLAIDSYNDKENAVSFFTGPTGFRWDGTVANDAQLESDVSIDWNTFWDVKTTISDTLWTAEMRIPWSSLRFQEVDGRVTMGVTVWWFISAKNELVIYPPISPQIGPTAQWKPSLMQEYHFEGVRPRKPLYIAPYLLAGIQQSSELDVNATNYLKQQDPTFEAGLDVKYSLTSNLTMDLTVNTDFAQVEADDQQVNLTRFSLFFPEKRLFFQERASIFNFNFDDFNRLFYSRRIGIDDDGNPIRIYGGAKLVGRLGKFDVGLLNMQADGVEDLSSENFGVLRLRRQVFNQYSNVGAIFTNRTDFDGSFNSSYGLDGIFRVVGTNYLTARMAQTFSDGSPNEPFSLAPTRLYLDWERRSTNGFFYKATYSRSGEDYDPGVGFELRGNTSSITTRLGYGKLMPESSKILNWQLLLDGTGFINNTTDTLETFRIAPNFQWSTKDGWFSATTLSYNREYVPEAFELSEETEVPIGNYEFWQVNAVVGSPFQQFFGAIFDLTAGGFYGGDFLALGIFPRFRVSKYLGFDGFYQFNRVNFKSRPEVFIAHLARLKAELILNTRLSLASFLQYNSLDNVYSGNIRFRFNPQEGHDLYLVYNDLLNAERQREIPHLPFSEERAVVVKYTYTFRIGN